MSVIDAQIKALIAHRFQRAKQQFFRDFDPSQPRDEHGRWTDAGGSDYGGAAPAAPAIDTAKVEAKTQSNVTAASAKALANGVTPLPGSKGEHPNTIGSRQPTAKGAKLAYGQPDVASMKLDPKRYAHDVALLGNADFYPNFRPAEMAGSTDAASRAAVDHMKANLKFLYSFADPHTQVWYDGARALVDDRAKLWGFNDASVAAVYAALSPTKDWDQNVHIADMLMKTYKTQQGHRWDDAMDAKAKALWSDKNQAVVDLVRGKTLGELESPAEKALWIRTYDETHNSTDYRTVLPNGALGAIARNKHGSPAKVVWQSLASITNAVKALEANGDTATISAAMGTAHKVRSFYNNILDPHSANGDVTIDTHAVGAALLRSLSNKTVPVLHNFGLAPDKADKPDGWEAAGASVKTGLSGLYPVYAEAYREAAKELGIQPRQLQSAVWVVKREAFGNLSKKQIGAIEDAWRTYHGNPKQTLEATQQTIAELAGLKKHERHYRHDEEGRRLGDAGELHRDGLGQAAAGMDGGAGNGIAERIARLDAVRDARRRAAAEEVARAERASRWQQLRQKWDESQHPRDPAGTPTGGQFTSSGGGGSSGSGGEAAAVQADPEVVNVGGDKWNQEIAKELEREYQAARPELEALATDAVGESTVTEPDEDEEEAPYVPEEWDSLSGDDQTEAESEYKNKNHDDYLQSETDNWYSESAPDDARVMVAADFNDGTTTDWVSETLDDLRNDRKADGLPDFPFTDQQIMDALTIDYEAYGGGGTNDPEFSWDDDKLTAPAGYDPNQPTLPGIEPQEPADYLTAGMREEIEKALEDAFNKQGDDQAGKMDPPDYLGESVDEYLGESWSMMSDSEKFAWLESNTNILEKYQEAADTAAAPQELVVEALPSKFDPLQQNASAEQYQRTQALARYLSAERAVQVLEDRKLPVPSRQALANIDSQLWGAWKSSSTSKNGMLLQVATAEELEGRLNAKTATEINPDAMKRYADQYYPNIGGYAGVKAYVRAKWEVTQYLLDKGGIKTLQLYRGIRLPPEVIAKRFKHLPAGRKIEGHTLMPTLEVVRNGAASTSLNAGVSNGWGADANRIVLRIEVPRTAALSVPAYGINVHSEREVVVAGTAWKGWDAWRGTAPDFHKVPLAA
ncbi:hypothetical protein I6F35_02800 [Bradyrhizobium sp. BRP22]|uniref:DUF7178 family protein n=1 Tax=Bradyrhizobium sp. BRP22 TaxID=2793821 RepID=UPI001CD43BC9|nr:hypothetical protein [Bradyrhizobium sp. BRP22]MCA1452143.1 hypothetical protein [Bradyrhizobium sp. BRP22]